MGGFLPFISGACVESSRAEAAGPARELGCLSSLQTDRRILLTRSLSGGFKRDLNLKGDIPHRPT